MLIPFERQDINHAADKFRIKKRPIEEGNRFIAVFDQTYGSLRLTSRIMEKNILREVLIETRNLATNVTVVQLEAES
jgi:DEAD/DEAH box helicase domain-containing protein